LLQLQTIAKLRTEVAMLQGQLNDVAVAQNQRLAALQQDALGLKAEAAAIVKESQGVHQLIHTVLIGHQETQAQLEAERHMYNLLMRGQT
jgi:hypothetical protein